MDFKSYCLEKINKIETEIKELKDKIAQFPCLEDIKIEEYGSKKAISANIIKQKGKKIRHVFFRPSKTEVKNYIRKKEISSLENHIKKLTEEKKQLINALESFDSQNMVFTKSVYPNNHVIKTILDYIQKNSADIVKTFILLISLFKTVTEKEVSLIGKIEYDISSQFDDKFNLKKEASIPNIIFSLTKLFKGILGEDGLDTYEISIESIKSQVRIHEKREEFQELDREKLAEKQNAIKELQNYIRDNEIIAPAPSIEYFKKLLDIVGIDQITAYNYCTMMMKLLRENELKEKLEILKRNLTQSEVETWQKAKSLESEIENQDLRDLLNRLTKDVVSACKYLEMLPLPEERDATYEIISQKIESLISAISNIKSPNSENSAFYYATNQECVPYALLNIESMDTLQYEEIFNKLQALALGEISNTATLQIKDINLKIIEGTDIDIYYTDTCDKPIIVSVHHRTISNTQPVIPKSVRESIVSIIKAEKTEEFKKSQETYEKLLLQSLDIRTLNDTRNTYKLKFTKPNK